MWYENGNILYDGNYINGQKVDTHNAWYQGHNGQNGNIKHKEHYVNGIKDGPQLG